VTTADFSEPTVHVYQFTRAEAVVPFSLSTPLRVIQVSRRANSVTTSTVHDK